MSQRVLRVRPHADQPGRGAAAAALEAGIARIRAEQELPDAFPDDVLASARASAAAPRLPALDRTDLAFVTLDPDGAMDLDQAMHLERDGDGHVVHYAIADVMAFVRPGDPVDEESHRRGETCYGADEKVPLHPEPLSEDAASLLPGETRPALLWTLRLDARGEVADAHVERALVRSRERWDYEAVQRQLDEGTEPEPIALLREVGERRLALERERGAISLPLPEQEIDVHGDHATLAFRAMTPVESWNAQISLMTGFSAAAMMLRAGVGVLRTLPEPDPRDVRRLRGTARALGVAWPADQEPAAFIASLDPSLPEEAAMTVACTRLLRGSGYTTFTDGAPEDSGHAALAADYAHVTAPLRRLVDRYAGEICLAICAEQSVPDWVLAGLDDLPRIMTESGRRAGAYERAVLDLVEALVLEGREGEDFRAVVLEAGEKDDTRGVVQLASPAVEARVDSERALPVGEEVVVRLVEADPVERRVAFEV